MANFLTQSTIQESKTLWIGDIESWMDEAYIANLFENIGIASIKIIRDKNTKLPVGYGFIEFNSHQLAQQILAMYNGRQIPGTMKLNWGIFGGGIKPTQLTANNTQLTANNTQQVVQQQPAPAIQSTAKTTSGLQQDYQIYVGDIDPSINDQGIYDFFHQKYQTVIGAKIIIDPTTRYSKGYGFVKFSNFEDSQRAIKECHGMFFKGRYLKCSQGIRKTDNPLDVSYNTALASINSGLYTEYPPAYQNTYDDSSKINYYNNFGYGSYDWQTQQEQYAQQVYQYGSDSSSQYYQAYYQQYYQSGDPSYQNPQYYQSYNVPNTTQQYQNVENYKQATTVASVQNSKEEKQSQEQIEKQELIDDDTIFLQENYDFAIQKIVISVLENKL